MSRIEKTLKSLTRPALITFITAGDPEEAASLDILKSLPDAGADIVELGMPFSDPMADGPVIQAASQRALAAGATMKQTLQMVRDFRTENTTTPLVLMGYANPVYAYGVKRFVADAAEAGVDGLIIVDVPPEEDAELRGIAAQANIDLIRLITPTTDEHRLQTLLEGASGFLYYVSITGVTGTASADIKAVESHVRRIREQTDLPVCIGFGIKTPDDAASMGRIGAGVVVGSALVREIEDAQTPRTAKDHILEKVKGLSEALEKLT